jgi:hypothetical protein
MSESKDTQSLNLDKNPRYNLIRIDNNSWLKNVKRFSHNFSTFLFQLPIFFVGNYLNIFSLKKYKDRRKSYKILKGALMWLGCLKFFMEKVSKTAIKSLKRIYFDSPNDSSILTDIVG